MVAIEADPYQQYPRASLENVSFRTGDAVIDQWEADLAAGKDPDFNSGVDAAFLAKFKAYSERKVRGAAPPPKPAALPEVDLSDIEQGFDDTY
jgi:hypothetical protein